MNNLSQFSGNNETLSIMFFVLIFAAFLAIFVSLFTALAINEDAEARGIKNRTLFAVLGFFFPLVVAIVYLIVRNNLKRIQPKICNHCGLTIESSFTVCPQCGSPEFTYYLIPDAEKHNKRAKSFSIVALVFYIIILIISIVAQFTGLFYTSNFARDNNNYSYNNDYQYNGDSDEFDDDNDSDYDDFFNQFGDGQNDSQNDGQFSEEQPIQ